MLAYRRFFFVRIFRTSEALVEAKSLRRRCSVASMNISRVIYVGMDRASMGGMATDHGLFWGLRLEGWWYREFHLFHDIALSAPVIPCVFYGGFLVPRFFPPVPGRWIWVLQQPHRSSTSWAVYICMSWAWAGDTIRSLEDFPFMKSDM